MTAAAPIGIDRTAARVPMTRLVRVELRKMFDTRSGFWLMTAIIGFALLATIAVLVFVGGDDLTYSTVTAAIAVPMSILLPVMAILTVTSEWSQRTGLTTFALVPARGRVLGAKAIAAVGVGVVSMLLALAIGALGNLIGAAADGIDAVWDFTGADVGTLVLANVLSLLIGFMLGVLIRNSPGAIVAYFVYMFVVPTVFGALAATQSWFEGVWPWVDFNYSVGRLYDAPGAHEWATLGVSGLIWLIIPMGIGLFFVMRAEIK